MASGSGGAGAGAGDSAEDAAARMAALDPFPDCTEEEIVAMLDAYERSGSAALGPVPEDLTEMMRNVRRGRGQRVEEEAPSELVTPKPS